MSEFVKLLWLRVPTAERDSFRQSVTRTNMRRIPPVVTALLLLALVMLTQLFYLRAAGGSLPRFGIYAALIFTLAAICGAALLLSRLYRMAPEISGSWAGAVSPLTAWLMLIWAAVLSLSEFSYVYLQLGIYVAALFLCACVFLLDAPSSLIAALTAHIVFVGGAFMVLGAGAEFQRLSLIASFSMAAAFVVSRVLYAEAYEHYKVERAIYQSNTQLFLLNEELSELSITDPLTKLTNRRRFGEISEQEWRRARRDRRLLVIAMADVDDFKAYNDFYGHQAGDDCLRKVADAMRETLRRANDIIARYGGEEFIVVMCGSGELEKEVAMLERVKDAVEHMGIPHVGSRAAQVVTITIGAYALVPTAEDSLDEAIYAADQALYAAKRAGRNKLVVRYPVAS